MVMLLVILALIYSQARKPQTWSWLTGGSQQTAETGQNLNEPPPAPANEKVIPALTDLDPAEAAEAAKLFEAVSDRSPVSAIEMPAYWRCLKWAMAQSSPDLFRRAQPDVFYTRLWEQPDKYRGKPFRLRLHVRRVLEHEPVENSVGVTKLYEAWGVTDESKTHPYVVLFSELPAGLPLGSDLYQDVTFAGYFLKTMSYTSADTTRAAPLLIGRIMPLPAETSAPLPSETSSGNDWIWMAVVAALVAAGIGWRIFFLRRPRKSAVAARSTSSDENFDDWLSRENLTDEQRVHTNGKGERPA
jgi:hypothetical protein